MIDAPPADRQLLQDTAVRAILAEGLAEAFRAGPGGWFDDSWLLSTPWGFAPGDVLLPVALRYGRDDRNVPVTAAKRLRRRCQTPS